MRTSTALKGTESVPSTKSVPFTTRERLRLKIVEATEGHSSGQIASICVRSKDTVKSWHRKNGRCPDADAIANLARALPSVRMAIAEDYGFDRAMSSGSSDAVANIVRTLAMGEGADAQLCRAILRQADGTHAEIPLGNLDWRNARMPQIAADSARLEGLREERTTAKRCEELAREIEAEGQGRLLP